MRNYEEIHTKLTLRYLTFAKYVPNHAIDTPGMLEPDFNCFSEFWYEDIDQLQKAQDFLQSDDYKVIAAGEETFLDREKGRSYMVDERLSDL